MSPLYSGIQRANGHRSFTLLTLTLFLRLRRSRTWATHCIALCDLLTVARCRPAGTQVVSDMRSCRKNSRQDSVHVRKISGKSASVGVPSYRTLEI